MRYCMNFYLNWCRNYAWSKLEVCFLLSKYRSSSFDHAQFLCHLRQKCIQYLILKLQSIVKKGGKGQRMFAFLCSKIALCSWDFQYIKWALLQQNLQALQVVVKIHRNSIQNFSEQKVSQVISHSSVLRLVLTFNISNLKKDNGFYTRIYVQITWYAQFFPLTALTKSLLSDFLIRSKFSYLSTIEMFFF